MISGILLSLAAAALAGCGTALRTLVQPEPERVAIRVTTNLGRGFRR